MAISNNNINNNGRSNLLFPLLFILALFIILICIASFTTASRSWYSLDSVLYKPSVDSKQAQGDDCALFCEKDCSDYFPDNGDFGRCIDANIYCDCGFKQEQDHKIAIAFILFWVIVLLFLVCCCQRPGGDQSVVYTTTTTNATISINPDGSARIIVINHPSSLLDETNKFYSNPTDDLPPSYEELIREPSISQFQENEAADTQPLLQER